MEKCVESPKKRTCSKEVEHKQVFFLWLIAVPATDIDNVSFDTLRGKKMMTCEIRFEVSLVSLRRELP